MADTTYRTVAIINAGNRRRFYARLAEMIYAVRDAAGLNLVALSQDVDGRVRIVLSNPVGPAAQTRWFIEPHPSP